MSLLESLQQECADRLSALPAFARVPVLVEHRCDYASEYQRALGPLLATAGTAGACVTVLTPTANARWPEVGGPFFAEIPLVARVQENPAVNRDPARGTGQSALTICEAIAAAWCQFYPVAASGPLVPGQPTIERGPEGDFVNYQVRFLARGGVGLSLPQCAAPTLFGPGPLVTLACATPGAAIFYTQDGSGPGPRNGTLYTAPFTQTGPVKARAWLMGYTASATLTA